MFYSLDSCSRAIYKVSCVRNFVHEMNESLGKLISCLYRYSQMYLQNQLEQYNIGSGQFSFLRALFHRDGIHQEDLVQSLNIDKATCTRAIKKLVKEGYVIKQRDVNDRRAYKIFLTEKARTIESVLDEISLKWKAILLSGFTKEEQKVVMTLLKKMVDNASLERVL